MRRAPVWAYRDDERPSNPYAASSPDAGISSSPEAVSPETASAATSRNSSSSYIAGGRGVASANFTPDYDESNLYETVDDLTSPSDRSILRKGLSRAWNALNPFGRNDESMRSSRPPRWTIRNLSSSITILFLVMIAVYFYGGNSRSSSSEKLPSEMKRPKFVFEHPYISSSYYAATSNEKTLKGIERMLERTKEKRKSAKDEKGPRTRLAIVRPFCEFDADALPTTFACWNSLVPCKAAQADLGDEFDLGDGEERIAFRDDSFNVMGDAAADVFLFYSQSYANSPVAMKSADEIINTFLEIGGWSQCFENIYAIEANIPEELDLYIPSAQEDLYNWVNGPNRQFEAAFRIIQSGEWGDYDGFYLMEGDSIPIKSHWLDNVLVAIEDNRPFAICGAKYNGDKWDNFYEQIPISLLHHINGNAIYNVSHPLLERLVGQLEVEAPCPYNSIPYDYRMSQMCVEGALGLVPKLAPKIMLNDVTGGDITLSNNTEMFSRWWDMYKDAHPFKETPVIHNYAATNLIPRHLGPEFIIHGAKLYSPWDPTRTVVTLVISEWFQDRSHHLLSKLDMTDHPFSEVVVMLPPDVPAYDEYNMTVVPVRAHHRSSPDYMDLCEAPIDTEWFMITNSYHHVATHVDLMFTPGKFAPVIPFTPATYPFCFKFPYCKEAVNLAQRFKPGHDKVVLDFDMLYNTQSRNDFCTEWKTRYGNEGEDLYKLQKKRLLRRKNIIGPKGPTGTAYTAYLIGNGLDKMYKFTDRSLYGARDPFIKIFAMEEKLDGMSPEELAKRVGLTGFDNVTQMEDQKSCNCKAKETRSECEGAGMGCSWRSLFESCHPPEMIDGGSPICPQSDSPTMAPTNALDGPQGDSMEPTASPTKSGAEEIPDAWYSSLFKTREHTRTREEEDLTMEVDTREEEEAVAPVRRDNEEDATEEDLAEDATNSTDTGEQDEEYQQVEEEEIIITTEGEDRVDPREEDEEEGEEGEKGEVEEGAEGEGVEGEEEKENEKEKEDETLDAVKSSTKR